MIWLVVLEFTSEISIRIYVRRLWHLLFFRLFVENGPPDPPPLDPKSDFVSA